MQHLSVANIVLDDCPLVIAVQGDGDVFLKIKPGTPHEHVVGLIHEIANKLAVESDEIPEEGPEAGHQFHITIQSQGSTAVVKGTHSDSDWVSDPIVATVRAWNLTDALRKAASLPLVAWAGWADMEAQDAEEAALRDEEQS